MKKLPLILLSLFVGIALPLLVFAQVAAPTYCTIRTDTGITDCPVAGSVSTFSTEYNNDAATPGAVSGAICCLFSSLNYIVTWIYMILIVLSAIIVIFGGVTLAMAGGEPDKVKTGKNLIIYAIVGFAVALISRGIPYIVKSIMGIS